MTLIDIAPRIDRSAALHGLGALTAALDVIGSQSVENGDHAMAKIICDAELDLRAVIRFVLAKLSQE
jgi:hypothetical protein